MDSDSAAHRLRQLFSLQTVVDLPSIRAALGAVSAMTAFRHLREVPYRRSYNHNGRYYTLYDPTRYDRFGLWSSDGIHFSVDGSLRKTVRRLVEEAEAGATHQELQQRLQVRVHNTLLDLLRRGEIERERLWQVYVYLHLDADIRATQCARRRELIERGRQPAVPSEPELDYEVIIQVLLSVLHHRGADPQALARHLRGRSPPISIAQVRAVFARYALDELGEKGGSSKS